MKTLVHKMRSNSAVKKIDETDGVKLYMAEGWVLMRPSGTEPIFRVYAESKEKATAEKLATVYKKLVDEIIATV